MKIRLFTFEPTITNEQIASTSILLADISDILQKSMLSIVEVAHSASSEADRQLHKILIQKGISILVIKPKLPTSPFTFEIRSEDQIASNDGLLHFTEEHFINSNRYNVIFVYPDKAALEKSRDNETYARLDLEQCIVTVTISPTGKPMSYKCAEEICHFFVTGKLETVPAK